MHNLTDSQRIENIYDMVKERINAFWKRNKRFPTSIIFYRDGISESQFLECKKFEIMEVRRAHEAAFKERNQSGVAKLRLTFIVVGKRHNTRFYPADQHRPPSKRVYGQPPPREGLSKSPNITENGNLKPGLLVDSVVTSVGYRNFFLQSHDAIKGTARAAHYHVLHDDRPWKIEGPDKPLANLTYNLCHAFARATKGVSYATPAYIADRLCERGRVYLREWNHGPGFDKPENDVDWQKRRVDEKKQEGLQAKNNKNSQTKKGGKETKDQDGELSKEDILSWKKFCVERLIQKKEWGHGGKPEPNDPSRTRHNPWHPDLDEVMFWM